jgi:hypothetical protein
MTLTALTADSCRFPSANILSTPSIELRRQKARYRLANGHRAISLGVFDGLILPSVYLRISIPAKPLTLSCSNVAGFSFLLREDDL